jgi:hypothetical protein
MGDQGRVPVSWHIPEDLKAYVDRLAIERSVSGWEAVSDIIRVHRFARDHQEPVKDRMKFRFADESD